MSGEPTGSTGYTSTTRGTGHVLAIDQGTTSTRAIVFDAAMHAKASAQEEFVQHFPRSGWVEHDPDDLWQTTLRTCREAIARAGIDSVAIAGIGITNQRETTLLWERATGRPIGRAIVWQDRRTAAFCDELRAGGHEPGITDRTGLIIDPYFSATKARWLIEHHDLTARAAAGEIAFGTVDSWLIWNLTGGARQVTDATNASRTLLYDIGRGAWDDETLALLGLPAAMLPEVLDCAAVFGSTDPALLGAAIPILGVAGDQQAATLGQACFQPGMVKSTYGTGCFALLNTGETLVRSSARLLSTIAYRLDGRTTYALEGSIFVAGAVVQWLRDGLGIIAKAADTHPLAERADESQRLVLVPAFTGLGAPYWRPEARGAVFGLTRNSGPAEFARAALESVGFQTRDLLEAMRADWPEASARVLRVDGGMSASDWAMQFLADIIGAPVDRPEILETTALGAAWLAGMQAGLYPGQEGFAETWRLERRFEPRMEPVERDARYADWRRAVDATIGYAAP